MKRMAPTVLTIFLAVLAGCAGQPGPDTPADGDGETTTESTATPVDDSGDWTTYQADVTAVRRDDSDPRSLLLDVKVLAGADGCSRNPRVGYYTEENHLIHANIVQDSKLAGTVGGCPSHATAVVKLTSPKPIDDRRVVLNNEPWKPVGKAYERCDKTRGCDPLPSDHCHPNWIHIAVDGLDVSRHSTGHVEGCDGSWLVMTVPDDPVPCGAAPRPDCQAVVNTRRYFMRWVAPSGWSVIATSKQPGCGTISTVEPTFPRKLCAHLPTPS